MDGVRRIVHVDMDAFYASIEQRDDKALRGRPVAVGGRPEGRGVVAAASYEARRHGVRSAMPAARAARLCPDLVFVPTRFEVYRAVSRQVFDIFRSLTDLVEPLSLDEAYLDVTTNALGLASGTEAAQHIRARISSELGLTCSAGVAPLKFVAKIASDYRKPDGLTVVRPHQVLGFVHPMPVRKLWGVGPATEERLGALGVRTIGDLARLSEGSVATLGRHGRFLQQLARGEDPRAVTPSRVRKSRGSERTFEEDIIELSVLLASLDHQVERVCAGLAQADERGRTVTLKVRYADFTTITRARTLDEATHDPALVGPTARALLSDTEAGVRPVRLLGVTVSGLAGARVPTAQLLLPYPPTPGADVL